MKKEMRINIYLGLTERAKRTAAARLSDEFLPVQVQGFLLKRAKTLAPEQMTTRCHLFRRR